MLAVPHEHLRAALDLPPSSRLDSPERTLALKKVSRPCSRFQKRAKGRGASAIKALVVCAVLPLPPSSKLDTLERILALKKVFGPCSRSLERVRAVSPAAW
jgi:hypothetical protein